MQTKGWAEHHSDVIMSQYEEMLGQIKRHSVSNIQMGWYVYLTVAVTEASGIATFSLTWVSQDSWLENIIGGSTGVYIHTGNGKEQVFFRDQIFPVPVPSKKEQNSRDRDATLCHKVKSSCSMEFWDSLYIRSVCASPNVTEALPTKVPLTNFRQESFVDLDSSNTCVRIALHDQALR